MFSGMVIPNQTFHSQNVCCLKRSKWSGDFLEEEVGCPSMIAGDWKNCEILR